MSGAVPDGIRDHFPALRPGDGGRIPVYLDSACTTLRAEPVIEAMTTAMRDGLGCPGRTNHAFGRETSRRLADAREVVRGFVGAASADEIVFCRNATEAINVVAAGLPLRAGDAVVSTTMEHNSNLLPWQRIARARHVRHGLLDVDPERGLDLGALESDLRRGDVKLVAVPHASNLSGVELPVAEIAALARRHGAAVLVDAAQSAATHRIDVGDLGIDFLAWSFHKMFGPTGIGALYGKADRLRAMPPLMVGGDTVDDVHLDRADYAPPPRRFEAGIGNVEGIIGAAAAVRFLQDIGPDAVRRHAVALNELATRGLRDVPGLHVIGPPDAAARGAILNFHVDRIAARAIASLLDHREGIMVRYGVHCAHAWYHAHDLPDSVRASFSIYNTADEVDRFVDVLRDSLAALR